MLHYFLFLLDVVTSLSSKREDIFGKGCSKLLCCWSSPAWWRTLHDNTVILLIALYRAICALSVSFSAGCCSEFHNSKQINPSLINTVCETGHKDLKDDWPDLPFECVYVWERVSECGDCDCNGIIQRVSFIWSGLFLNSCLSWLWNIKLILFFL